MNGEERNRLSDLLKRQRMAVQSHQQPYIRMSIHLTIPRSTFAIRTRRLSDSLLTTTRLFHQQTIFRFESVNCRALLLHLLSILHAIVISAYFDMQVGLVQQGLVSFELSILAR